MMARLDRTRAVRFEDALEKIGFSMVLKSADCLSIIDAKTSGVVSELQRVDGTNHIRGDEKHTIPEKKSGRRK